MTSQARKSYNLTRDAVPADTGCSLSPSCLQCPLPVCKYDMTPQELQRAIHGRPLMATRGPRLSEQIIRRRESVRQLWDKGKDVYEIAGVLNVSIKTAYRDLQVITS